VNQRLLVYAGLILLLCGAYPMLLERYLNHVTFYPAPGIDVNPDQFELPVEQLYLDSVEGVRIHAFFVAVPESNKALLYLHGNAGNASHRLPTAVAFARLGQNVLLIDYQGYGLSAGQPSESGIYVDGRAGLEYLQTRGFETGNISLFGRSLGGAVAVDIARQQPLAGVILCSTFSSGADMARAMGLGLMVGLVRNRFNSVDKIRQLKSPLLSLHGDNDQVIPLRLGKKLFDAAPGNKLWRQIDGAGHNDIMESGGDRFWQPVREFLGTEAKESSR